MAKTWTRRGKSPRAQQNDPFARSDATAARAVLRDCHRSARELAQATTPATWRLRWITTVVLLRTVGHVLDKVDGARSPYLRGAIDREWARVKSYRADNLIFHDFIEQERNSIAKEYEIGARLVQPVAEDSVPALDAPVFLGDRIVPQRAVIKEAISWWERLLTEVETSADGALHEDLRARRRTSTK
ncbi:hypothetical protein [Phenylobacterium sp. NIBR 498073]|uniref:hypothetical protein n=1 Tax=Phenylobacterium sp. NIBR 498073 TaxID=3015177 RepID=UPI0022B3ABF2|nr:hypothetical protein [Phenylobacterium sp. NIBR 498073]WGU41422.1 hypothetical protein O4N75_06765 [Phenylobacterium sp. NIBR 498073]